MESRHSESLWKSSLAKSEPFLVQNLTSDGRFIGERRFVAQQMNNAAEILAFCEETSTLPSVLLQTAWALALSSYLRNETVSFLCFEYLGHGNLADKDHGKDGHKAIFVHHTRCIRDIKVQDFLHLQYRGYLEAQECELQSSKDLEDMRTKCGSQLLNSALVYDETSGYTTKPIRADNYGFTVSVGKRNHHL